MCLTQRACHLWIPRGHLKTSDLGAACWLSRFMLCHPSWSVGEWGACSQSCGGGEQTRLVQCIQRTSRTDAANLSDAQCVQPAPVRRQACNTHSCPPVWSTGPWSQVSLDKRLPCHMKEIFKCTHICYVSYLQQETKLFSTFPMSPEPKQQRFHQPFTTVISTILNPKMLPMSTAGFFSLLLWLLSLLNFLIVLFEPSIILCHK